MFTPLEEWLLFLPKNMKVFSLIIKYTCKSVLGNKCTSFNPNARAHLNDIIRQLGAVTKLLWIVGNCW